MLSSRVSGSLTPGPARLSFLPSTQPTDRTSILWTKSGRGHTSRRGWKLLSVRNDAVEVELDRGDELPPTSAAWLGDDLILAPFAAPRLSDPAQWGEEVTRYLALIGDGEGDASSK